ncbi:MAG: hypothetical protein R2864_08615 [Syntrophotaleaceae bacterium]
MLLRLVLWWQFGLSEGVTATSLPPLVLLGILHDAQILPFILGPLAVLLCLLPTDWAGRRWLRFALGGVQYLWLFGLVYLPFVECFFFRGIRRPF